MRPWKCGAAMAALMLPVAAQAMTVDEFLAKAKALQAQGPFALASSDPPLLRAEIKTDAAAYRAQIETDKLAGKPPRACPPPVGTAKIDATTVMAEFQAIAPPKRSVSVRTAFYAMMDRRYPCR